MFGQSPFTWPPPVDGAVVVPGAVVPSGVVVLGADDAEGSGLAAETAATPPTASRPTARVSVARPRRIGGDVHSMAGSPVRGLALVDPSTPPGTHGRR